MFWLCASGCACTLALCFRLEVVLRPRGSKQLSVDQSACSWIGVVIAHGCAC